MRMPELVWNADETELTVDGIAFRTRGVGKRASTPEQFTMLKTRPMVEGYVQLLQQLEPQRIVELGIFAGGSAAMLELLAQPETLVAIEYDPDRIVALDEFVATRPSGTGRIHAHYGLDQADRQAVFAVLHDALGSKPEIDLVLDDASHELDRTRESFNMLFPMIRPGGAYVIEDWGWGHFVFARERRGPSLAKLVMECLLTIPYQTELVDRIEVNKYWAVVWRGDAPTPDDFDLRNHVSPRGEQLLDTVDEDPRLR